MHPLVFLLVLRYDHILGHLPRNGLRGGPRWHKMPKKTKTKIKTVKNDKKKNGPTLSKIDERLPTFGKKCMFFYFNKIIHF